MITFNNICKKYKNNEIFENINLEFNNGRKILIKGVNGGGKSVLLRLIVGYSTADIGTITIDEYTLKQDCDFIKNAGVSINAPDFNKNISGMDNLLYLAKIRKVATRSSIDTLVKYFKLDDVIYKKYKTYSLGMKQKMRIIQAIMDKPTYLILDEPFDALDKESQQLAVDLLNKYLALNKNATIIYTTHNEIYQDDFADEIYEINNKKIEKVEG